MPPRVKLKVPRVRLERALPTKAPEGIYRNAIQCRHCEHWYLSPCDHNEARDRCPNYQHLQDARLVDRLAAEHQQSKKVKRK